MDGKLTPPAFDWGRFIKGVIEDHIRDAQSNRQEMKARIVTAFQHGHLTADEAEEWIVLHGLEND